jgi:SAM-dependent methyltransferase
VSHLLFDEEKELGTRRALWSVIVDAYLQRFISVRSEGRLLDAGSGWGGFINAVKAPRKFAIDCDSSFGRFVESEVSFSAQDLGCLAFVDESFDAVFASNVLEHLPSRDYVLRALIEFHRVLTPNGILIVLQPNFRYCFRNYYDIFDHCCAYTERSMVEALRVAGFSIFERVIGRFLPFTTKSRLPQWPWLVRVYLRMPIAWHVFGRQFFIVARKASRPDES